MPTLEPPIDPMLAKLSESIPRDDGWLYEPKWDGFRCIVYFDGQSVYLQSRDRKPLNRYFPEVESGLADVLPEPCVLDGEIVVMGTNGLEFETLQQRIHPAESRVQKLAVETPAVFVAFDLLLAGNDDLRGSPFSERHRRLKEVAANRQSPLFLTPSTTDPEVAQDWFNRFEGAGFDGVVAKRLTDTYQAGKRIMLKIKHLRTADTVVAGFRWGKDAVGTSVGALLLGLYDDAGVLHHVGHTSSFTARGKQELVAKLAPYITEDESEGFGQGRTPGAPSRWTGTKDLSWVRLRPELVCEVTFDYLQGPRFRHGATFQRWRTDKPPEQCRFDQFEAAAPYELQQVFAQD
ncbi:MAG TPA: ATP-dependent DNA ligase [Tepidiformaceae bacterium]|nr:ATP-dependent DNA ligase [Tepidiformaceae bacterium]